MGFGHVIVLELRARSCAFGQRSEVEEPRVMRTRNSLLSGLGGGQHNASLNANPDLFGRPQAAAGDVTILASGLEASPCE